MMVYLLEAHGSRSLLVSRTRRKYEHDATLPYSPAPPPWAGACAITTDQHMKATQRFLEACWDQEQGPDVEGPWKAARRNKGTVHNPLLGRAAGDKSASLQRAQAHRVGLRLQKEA